METKTKEKLLEMLDKMSFREQEAVEAFAAFLLARKKKKLNILWDDIPSDELMKLLDDAGGFDWLESEEEDIYSLEDGDEIEWPRKS